MGFQGTFKCVVMTPDALLYQKEVHSVFVCGDRGEYELLAYHYPVIGIIEGNIIFDWKESLEVKFGLVKFFANECIILVEEKERLKPQKKKKLEDDIAVDTDMESQVR